LSDASHGHLTLGNLIHAAIVKQYQPGKNGKRIDGFAMMRSKPPRLKKFAGCRNAILTSKPN
jgi:hypothetical protein